jgi:hypothetical protein
MKEAYEKYCSKVSSTNFNEMNQTVSRLGYSPLKQENYQLEVFIKNKRLKDTPWLNKKEPFDNRENLYLRVVDLMKMFIRFEEKDFIRFVSFMGNFAHIVNKIELLRVRNLEFQILLYLINRNNRKLIALYLKIRREIVKRCGLDHTKVNLIFSYNRSRDFNSEGVELGVIQIDYDYWGVLAEVTRSPISEDMLWWVTDGNRK